MTLRDVSVVFPVNSSPTGQRDFLDWDHESIEFDQFNIDFPISSRDRRLNDLPTSELSDRINEIKREIRDLGDSIAALNDPDEKKEKETDVVLNTKILNAKFKSLSIKDQIKPTASTTGTNSNSFINFGSIFTK